MPNTSTIRDILRDNPFVQLIVRPTSPFTTRSPRLISHSRDGTLPHKLLVLVVLNRSAYVTLSADASTVRAGSGVHRPPTILPITLPPPMDAHPQTAPRLLSLPIGPTMKQRVGHVFLLTLTDSTRMKSYTQMPPNMQVTRSLVWPGYTRAREY